MARAIRASGGDKHILLRAVAASIEANPSRRSPTAFLGATVLSSPLQETQWATVRPSAATAAVEWKSRSKFPQHRALSCRRNRPGALRADRRRRHPCDPRSAAPPRRTAGHPPPSARRDRHRGRAARKGHPLELILTSMPGVGVRTAARLISEVSGKEFATAGHLASYAGLAPVTR